MEETMLSLTRTRGQVIELNRHQLRYIGCRRHKAVFRFDDEWIKIPRGETYTLKIDGELVDILCSLHGKQMRVAISAPMSIQIHREEAPRKIVRSA